MAEKCFCHFNGYEVKDAKARKSVSGIEENVNILKNRMDTFAALPEGSTTGDAELADARIGYDGTQYPSAGEAVRQQAAAALSFKSYVTEGINFDDKTDPGIYNITAAAAEASTNSPTNIGGMLTVEVNKTADGMAHIYVDTRGNLHTRYKTTAQWTEWKHYATRESVALNWHNDGVGALVEIAKTYFDVAYDPDDQIRYESARGLFAEQVTDDNGVKAIVCSQFVQACIAGIAYKCSRYVGTENSRKSWGFVSDGTGEYDFTKWNEYNDYMIAANQAKYFENLGQLKTFDVNRNALQPGDLLFYTNTESDKYKQIDHVAICLGADSTKHIIMHSWPKTRMIDGADTGVIVETKTYVSYQPSYYVRSPIRAEYASELLEAAALAAAGTYESVSQHIKSFYMNLERGFYTVHFDDTGDSPNGYVKVYYEDGTSANYVGVKNGGVFDVVFYAEMPVTRIAVMVSDGTTYSCSKAELHRGYHPEMKTA